MNILLEEERLEVVYDEIIWDRIEKEFCIKELNKKMLNEAKLLKETEEELFGMEHSILKAIH